jgi:hypothetical protein
VLRTRQHSIRGGLPFAARDEVESRVEARLERQAVLGRDARLVHGRRPVPGGGADVRRYTQMFHHLRTAALSPDDSTALSATLMEQA